MTYYFHPHYRADKPETWNSWESTTDLHDAYIRASGRIFTEYQYKQIIKAEAGK